MSTFIELTTMDGYPILINVAQVLRIATTTATEPDLKDSTFLHFADGSRQLVREPLREIMGLLKHRECAQTVPATYPEVVPTAHLD